MTTVRTPVRALTALLAVVLAALLAAPAATGAPTARARLGPAPVDCALVGLDYADNSCTTQTRLGTLVLAHHVLPTGGVLSGRVLGECLITIGDRRPCKISWRDFVALGTVVRGCRSDDATLTYDKTCVVRLAKTFQPVNTWQMANVYITNEQGEGWSKTFFAVTPGQVGIEGIVTTKAGVARPGAVVVVTRTSNGARVKATSNREGYYAAVVKPGTFVVSAKGYCVQQGTRCVAKATVKATKTRTVNLRALR